MQENTLMTGSHADGGMEGVVVGELGDGEEAEPIILEVIAEGPEVLFKDLVDPFCLAIRLGVECSREVWRDL